MKKLTAMLLCLVVILCWASPLKAQEGLIVDPAQITIAVTKGQTETRTLLIRAAGPVNNLRVIPLDLIGPNGDIVLPADAITVELPPTNIDTNAELTVPINFNLLGVPSGQFSGELLISYAGQSYTVPVSVAVKDEPWLPLAALVIGVALGVGVSAYRAQGRPRDEVLVRLGQIRTQMKVDQKLKDSSTPFFDRIDAELVDVEVALEAQQWEKARQSVMKAEVLWTRWRRGRPDWLVQLDYYDKLNEKLATLGDNIFYATEIKQAALNVHREIPNFDEPSHFRERLEPLARQVNTFIALDGRINELAALDAPQSRASAKALQRRLHNLDPNDNDGINRLKDDVESTFGKLQKDHIQAKIAKLEEMARRAVHQLPDTEAQTWQPVAQDLKARVAALDIGDTTAMLALDGDVDAAMHQIEVAIPRQEGTLRGLPDVSYGIPKDLPENESWLSSPPTIHIQSLEEQIPGAALRLRWFTWLTYIIAVVFLALAGFTELYSTRSDFGANGIGDYFALLAWGFGAEATRAAIADMVQGWSLSTGK